MAGHTADMFLRSIPDTLLLLEGDRGDEVLSGLAKSSLRDLYVLRCCGSFTTKAELSVVVDHYFSHGIMPNVRSQILLAHHHIFGALDESKRRYRSGRRRSK